MFRIFCLLIGYAFGCVQTAYIIGKAVYKIDIRAEGSGNAGTTNVTRIMGAKAGAIVFLVDVCKAVAAYVLCSWIFNGQGSFVPGVTNLGGVDLAGNGYLPGLYAGIGVVCGHNFPFYMKFKGGKGIASTVGVTLSFHWLGGLVAGLIGLMGVVITKYISVTSLILTALFPVTMIILRGHIAAHFTETLVLGFAVMAMAWYQHRGNIARLLKGTENKFSIGKGKKSK